MAEMMQRKALPRPYRTRPLDAAEQGAGMSDEPLMTVRSTAAYLALSESKIYHMVSKRRIPHVKIDAAVRFRKRDLKRFVLQHLHGKEPLENGRNGDEDQKEPGLQ